MSEKPLTPGQRLKSLEKEIVSAETEVTIRQRQLKELAPQRKALEEECRENFGCEIGNLSEALAEDEAEMETLVSELEKELEEAKSPKEKGE